MSDVFAQALSEVGREPLSMAVARQLRDAIVSGELADGTSLPSEKALSVRLGVGRSTVREALRILQAQGLVSGGDRVSTRGPTVDGSGTLPSAASALENVVLLGQVPLADLVSLRLLIEQAALEAAAARHDDAALDRAQAALDEMRDAKADVERFHKADVAFHAALIDAAGNGAYSLVANVLRDTTARHLREALEAEPRPAKVLAQLVDEHDEVLAALRSGHGKKAARLVRAHIETFYDRHIDT